MKKLTALLMAAMLLAQLWAVTASAAGTAFICDITMNGTIEAEDARLALRMSIGLENYTAAHKKLADADKDGVITPADARLILRVSIHLETGPHTMVILSDAEMNTFVFTNAASTIGKNPSGGSNEITEPLTNAPAPSEGNPPGGNSSVPAGNVPPMPTPSSVSGTFTFTVYGWGDGVGMSQYGAVGMSRAGFTYDQILKHYYTGVKIVTDYSYPSTTYYDGDTYNTEELLARIVYQEMFGITDDNVPAGAEALKAQTVAVFSLMKYYNFRVPSSDLYNVGIATSMSYYSLPSALQNLVHEVIGEYMAVSTDASSRPIEAAYCAMAGGRTVSAKDLWGSEISYLQSVSSPYEMSVKDWAYTFYFSKDQLRRIIMAYDSSIVLPADPSQWLEIVSHTASIDANRGYVKQIRVGNKTLDGFYDFCSDMMGDYFYSTNYFCATTCFYVTYTP